MMSSCHPERRAKGPHVRCEPRLEILLSTIRMTAWRAIAGLALGMAFTLVAAGCGGAAALSESAPASATSKPAASGAAAKPELDHVKFTVGTTNPSNIPLWLAVETGQFQKYGLTA